MSDFFSIAFPSADMLKDKQPMDKPLSLSKVLAVIGRGCSLVSIRRVALLVTVLPSLTLLYSVSSLCMHDVSLLCVTYLYCQFILFL